MFQLKFSSQKNELIILHKSMMNATKTQKYRIVTSFMWSSLNLEADVGYDISGKSEIASFCS